MKKALLSLWVSFSALAALAQNYSLDWSTVDGGGGTSAGGIYSVSGTPSANQTPAR
jgi:hypothetical protein